MCIWVLIMLIITVTTQTEEKYTQHSFEGTFGARTVWIFWPTCFNIKNISAYIIYTLYQYKL